MTKDERYRILKSIRDIDKRLTSLEEQEVFKNASLTKWVDDLSSVVSILYEDYKYRQRCQKPLDPGC